MPARAVACSVAEAGAVHLGQAVAAEARSSGDELRRQWAVIENCPVTVPHRVVPGWAGLLRAAPWVTACGSTGREAWAWVEATLAAACSEVARGAWVEEA